jgi:hypothetical protein
VRDDCVPRFTAVEYILGESPCLVAQHQNPTESLRALFYIRKTVDWYGVSDPPLQAGLPKPFHFVAPQHRTWLCVCLRGLGEQPVAHRGHHVRVRDAQPPVNQCTVRNVVSGRPSQIQGGTYSSTVWLSMILPPSALSTTPPRLQKKKGDVGQLCALWRWTQQHRYSG